MGKSTEEGESPVSEMTTIATVNIAINYDLRCYHIDQIDEDYILKLMEATRSDESAFIMEATGTNQKLIKEINEEILRFRKTNPERAKILDDMCSENSGLMFAVDFLTQVTKSVVGLTEAQDKFSSDLVITNKNVELSLEKKGISVEGKDVIVLGGGDTGNDCTGTSIRLGCKSVTQIEMMPCPPVERSNRRMSECAQIQIRERKQTGRMQIRRNVHRIVFMVHSQS